MGDKRNIYFVSDDGNLFCSDEDFGELAWRRHGVGVEFDLLSLSDQQRLRVAKNVRTLNVEAVSAMTRLRYRIEPHSRTSTRRHKAAGFIMRETITEIIAQLIAELLPKSAILVARSKVHWLSRAN